MTSASTAPSRRGWFDRLIDAVALAAGVMLCVVTLLICLDVVARYFLLFPMSWTLEVSEYLLYLLTFFGAPWVLREGGHIAIEIFVEQLPRRARRRVAYLTYVIGAVVSGILFYYSSLVWWDAFTSGVKIWETFVFPEWYLVTAAPPTFLILLVIFLRWMIRPETGPAAERRPGDA